MQAKSGSKAQASIFKFVEVRWDSTVGLVNRWQISGKSSWDSDANLVRVRQLLTTVLCSEGESPCEHHFVGISRAQTHLRAVTQECTQAPAVPFIILPDMLPRVAAEF